MEYKDSIEEIERALRLSQWRSYGRRVDTKFARQKRQMFRLWCLTAAGVWLLLASIALSGLCN